MENQAESLEARAATLLQRRPLDVLPPVLVRTGYRPDWDGNGWQIMAGSTRWTTSTLVVGRRSRRLRPADSTTCCRSQRYRRDVDGPRDPLCRFPAEIIAPPRCSPPPEPSSNANEQICTTSARALQLPDASDIAATSADLLFGEPVTWTIPDTTLPEGVEASPYADRLAELGPWGAQSLDAPEVCAALGGTTCGPRETTPSARTLRCSPSSTPTRRIFELRQHGALVPDTFRRILSDDRDVEWRHLDQVCGAHPADH